MLVRFTDTKDKTVWINPVHVKTLTEKKPEVTSINLNLPATAPVNVRMHIDEVAARLNAAMPLDPYEGVGGADGSGAADDGSGAIIAATTVL